MKDWNVCMFSVNTIQYKFWHLKKFFNVLIVFLSVKIHRGFFENKINLNCAHAVHLWFCTVSQTWQCGCWQTATLKMYVLVVLQRVSALASITWLTLIEYAAIPSLADHIKQFASYVCLSEGFSYGPTGRQTHVWSVRTVHNSNWMSENRITHVAVQEQLFKVLRWPYFQCFWAAPAVDCDCLAPFMGLK